LTHPLDAFRAQHVGEDSILARRFQALVTAERRREALGPDRSAAARCKVMM
jgi:hypothetical protein